jgi:alanine racemase
MGNDSEYKRGRYCIKHPNLIFPDDESYRVHMELDHGKNRLGLRRRDYDKKKKSDLGRDYLRESSQE